MRTLSMATRVEDRSLPEVEVVNMREEYVTQGKQVIFSRRLLEGITIRLERREQTMILLNRRGFASFLLCRHCGFTFTCQACSVGMTYHSASTNFSATTVVRLEVRRRSAPNATANMSILLEREPSELKVT